MSAPLDNPAELHSPLPLQILLGVFGCFLVLLEGALAQWRVFFAAVPLITLGYVYYMSLFYASRLSLLAVFIIGLFAEMMFWQMFGTISTSLCIAAWIVRWRAPLLQHAEFIEIWSNFSLIVLLVSMLRLLIYGLVYVSLPDLSLLAVQMGMSILLFPVMYVVLISAASLGEILLNWTQR